MKFNFLFIAMLIKLASLEVAASYSLKDLEALEKEKAYDEFFKHAQDIRPSERTDYWKEMVANMAEGYLKNLKQKLILKREDFQKTQQLALWSALNQNEFFKIHRADLAIKWFEQCLKDDASADSQCWSDFTDFWQNPKAFLDLSPKLLRLISPYLPSSPPDPLNPKHRARQLVSEYFIISPLMFSELAELQCQKPDIQRILWEKLKEEWQSEVGSKPLKTILNKYALNECWIKLKRKAEENIIQGEMTEEVHLSYEFLKSLRLISFPVEEAYALNYLLGYPTKGDTFNRSWALIKSLHKAPKKREDFMQKIRLWPKLPGEVFSTTDEIKSRAIIRHLSQNFPDFIDYYAHTCLNFYSGERSFPLGNPALHCKEFFATAKTVENALPESVVKRFELQFEEKRE